MHMREGANPAVAYQAACYQRGRRHQRFDLQFPVRLTFAVNGVVRELEAVSQNVSTCSLLLRASGSVPLHTQVNLTMTVRGEQVCRPILLLGQGEVVRVQSLGNGAGFALAIACDRPITEMETDRAAAS
ncbi:MAG: hypothetical protein WCA16_11970 [Candidatus Sulfotelmatobacter sp.]